MVVVVVPIGVVRGEQVDIRVSMTKLTTTMNVTAPRMTGLRSSGGRCSPQPESYES